MIKTKAAFLEGRLLSSQSKQFKKFSKSPDWLEKSRPVQNSHFCFDHVNRLYKNKQRARARSRLFFVLLTWNNYTHFGAVICLFYEFSLFYVYRKIKFAL